MTSLKEGFYTHHILSNLTFFFIPSKANIVYKKCLYVTKEGVINIVSTGQRRFHWWVMFELASKAGRSQKAISYKISCKGSLDEKRHGTFRKLQLESVW